MEKWRVFIIGAGNVATHLAAAIKPHVDLVGITSQSDISSLVLAENLAIPFISFDSEWPKADLTLILTSDRSVKALIESTENAHYYAYTSGSVPIDSIQTDKKVGVFYPLQTFSKSKPVDFSSIPFLIESKHEKLGKELFTLATKISNRVVFADSTERSKLHLGAVFVNNFVNHLAYHAKQYIEKEGVDWTLLQPLLKETVNKLDQMSPLDAQTGPARRNDQAIIQQQQSKLSGRSKAIYELMTDSILATYYDKL